VSLAKGENDVAVWKKRVLELEHSQQALSADFDLLNRLSQRLCVAARGQDAELDGRLDTLQEALKRAPGEAAFRGQASSVEKGMMHFFQRRDQLVKQAIDSLRTLLSLVGDHLGDPQQGSNLDALIAALPGLLENFYEYPAVLEQAAQFQQQAWSVQAPVAQGLDGAPSLQGAAVAGDDAAAEERELICRRVAVLLLDLVGQLSVPPVEMQRAHQLMVKIENGFGWDELERVLQSTVDLIVSVAVLGHAEFEGYLESLNNQLSDIQHFLGESRDDQRQSHASSATLDQAVRADVAAVEDSLQRASSLEQLKSSVRNQLGDIVQAMDRYRGELVVREQRVEKRLGELQQKLEAMEHQAQRVQTHLEEQRLRALSDPLTLLPNRAAYDERVAQEAARWARYAGELTMVVCDLDHFKKINDNYGHLAGDKVLRVVAKILLRGIRETDFVARYGGEEFVVLMPETDIERALMVMEKLRQTIEKSPFNFRGEPVSVTMSFGISCFGPQDQPDSVFERADKALYRAKGEGRNRCVVAA